jgi:hypothetical protein
MSKVKTVVVKTFIYRHQAELAKGLLEDEGIEAFIGADDLGGYRPDISLAMGNVRLYVAQAKLKQAQKILARLENNPET